MGGYNSDKLGDGFVSETVAQIEDVLGDVVLGRQSWEELCVRLCAALPGSATSFASYDLLSKSVLQAPNAGIEPDFIRSYVDHYAAVNGWIDFWATVPQGQVAISERDFPAATLRNTEFYQDWLLPQRTMEAASGVRFDVGDRDAVHLAWHYPLGQAPRYDGPAAAIIERLVPRIGAAVEVETRLRAGAEAGLRGGALIDRIGEVTVILDRNRRVLDANRAAQAAFQRGTAVSAQGDLLQIRDAPTQRWLEESLRLLATGRPAPLHDRVFSIERRTYRATITQVTAGSRGDSALLLPPRRLFMLILQTLIGTSVNLDGAALRSAFGLSAAEIRLCDLLVNGHSLQQAASVLELAEGTVRQRIKSVFQKTGTHRQGELVGVLARLGTPAVDGGP